MKKFLLGCFIFSFFSSFSQTEIETDTVYEYEEMPHSIYLELLGHGVIHSMNYERLIYTDRKWSPSIGAGFSFFYNTNNGSRPLLNINTQLNYNFDKKNRIHFGFGFTAVYEIKRFNRSLSLSEYIQEQTDWVAVGYLGYKYSIPNRNWFWGVTLSPIFSFGENSFFLPYGGLRIGYQFY